MCEATLGAVDLLLVVDTSVDSTGVNTRVAAALPDLIGALMDGDTDRDGTPDSSPAVGSLNIGAITADLGFSGSRIRGCDARGDEGLLQTSGNAAIPGCGGEHPQFRAVSEGEEYAEAAAAIVCVAFGVDGCGLGQMLASLSTALDTPGNAGFFRRDAALAIVFVTKADDCSVADPAFYRQELSSGPDTGCVEHAGMLQAPGNYAEALHALRPAGRVSMLVLGGIPPELDTRGASALVDHDALQPLLNPTGPSGMRSTCSNEDIGAAFPPHRLLQVAAQLEEHGGRALTGSVCHDAGGYQRNMLRFAETILESAQVPCP